MAALLPKQFSHYQHIAIAVIIDNKGNILISQRDEKVHQGGLWEFPGGKIEPGENIGAALKRELNEELGIHPIQIHPLIRIPYEYSEQSVFLDVWRVETFDGEASSREGQPIRWVALDELSKLSFPAANRSIIQALKLTDYLLITPDPGTEEEWPEFLSHLKRRLQSSEGSLQVILRAKSLNSEQYQKLAQEVAPICDEAGVTLQLTESSKLSGVGLHLTSAQLREAGADIRQFTSTLSASCHSIEELKLAEELGADYALLSPVQATKTHPDASPLGWVQFKEYTDQVSIPIYALGGMAPTDLERAQLHGAQGVAAIRALWNFESR